MALKVLGSQGVGDAVEQARFEREGRVLMSLSHPHIVHVVACGALEDGTRYVAMEWLSGEDVAVRIRRGPMPLGHALEIGRQVAQALDFAHRAGVIHRDIKPSNIFLSSAVAKVPSRSPNPDASAPPVPDPVMTAVSGAPAPGRGPSGTVVRETGSIDARSTTAGTWARTHEIAILDTSVPDVKLVDFGVALDTDTRLTRTGTIVGTPAYMAPEQARAEAPIDSRADLYSLGATLFELIAGRPPHLGPTAIATLARLVTTRAPRLSEIVAVPYLVDELLAALLQTNPKARPSSAAEVERSLDQLVQALAEGRLTVPPPVRSSQAPAQGTRLVTTVVGIGISDAAVRTRLVEGIRGKGADSAQLGHDAIVTYVGARRALGGEATRAIELGRLLADEGAQVGVATGRTQVDLNRPVGDVVDRAAALAHGAEPGQILADTTTTELARGRFEFQVRAGGSASVGARLVRRAEGAGGAPFVGRESELTQILAAYERCCEDPIPLVVSVAGPPGIGKTRLVREVLTRLSSLPDAPRILAVRCDPFGRAEALGTAADVVRGLFGVHRGLALDAAREALASVPMSDAVTENGRDLLARLLSDEPLPEGIEPRGTRDELWMGMTSVAVDALGGAPVVCVVEDAQWADSDSVLWIEHWVKRTLGRRLCVLLVARPEFWRDDANSPKFVGADRVQIDLRPVTKRAVRSIVKAVLGGRATDAVLDAIAVQAGGSPLFAEELARLTVLGRDADAAPTIEAAIQVSLDSLDEASRDALLCLSVFGMAGWDGGIEALGIDGAAERLRDLAAADLVVERADSRLSRVREWGFKHALVRDVAYTSLGPRRKKSLHALAGSWLARMGGDAARIAEHFDLGECRREASVYWEKAARRALATNALADAVRMADLALAQADHPKVRFARAQVLDEAWSRLDARAADRETAIVAMREAAYDVPSQLRTEGARARYDHARGTGFEVTERLVQVRDDAHLHGLTDEEARCTATLATRYAFSGKLQEAETESKRLLGLAETRGIPGAAVDAWQTLAVVRQTRGDLVPALEARRSAARAAHVAGLKEREGTLHVNVGFALTTMGAKDEARDALNAGLAIAHAIGSPEALRHARMNLLGWTATFGNETPWDEELSEPRSEADGASSQGWITQDRTTLGILYYRACELLQTAGTDEIARAAALLNVTVNGYRATGNNDVLSVALATWARAERLRGDRERARMLAEEARALLDKGAFSLLNEAPVYLALHELFLDEGDTASASGVIAAAIAPLARRLAGLAGTRYARIFLTNLPQNAALLAQAKRHRLLTQSILRELEDTRGETE